MFLLVPAYPGCPGSKAVKRSLLLLLSSYRLTQFYKYYVCCVTSLERIATRTMHTVAESTPNRGTDPLPVRSLTNDYGEPPVAGTLTGRPTTNLNS